MNNPYGLSKQTLDDLRENDPMLYAQFTRLPQTLPTWQAPPIDARRTIVQTVIALFNTPPAAPDDDGGDIIEGEWRNV